MAENTSEGKKLNCTTELCEEEAVIYCLVCKKLICKSHQEVHDGFMKMFQSNHEVISAGEYSPETEEKKFCTQHSNTPIVLACEKCYHPMCPKCLETSEAEAARCTDQEKHETKTIDQVAVKIQDEVKDLMSELRANELVNADSLKVRQKIFDEQTEENRLDLEILAVKIGELHKMVDEIGDKTKEALIKHMNEKKALLQKWERQFSDYQQTCNQTHNETSQTLRMSDEIIVKDQRVIKDVLSPLIEFELEDSIQDMKQLSLILKDEKIDFSTCIKLQETEPTLTPNPVSIPPPISPPIPTSVVFKEDGSSPSIRVYAVQYLKNGQLVYAGYDYGVKGLNYTPQIPRGTNQYIYSLFEHKSLLYILHYNHTSETYHIHILNLLPQSVQQSVIQYSGGGGNFEQLVVNDDYIIVTVYTTKSVKVFSSNTHAHQFDIKHDCINSPCGVDFLNNTIVVADWKRNQISNITIGTSPELKWTCEGMTNPTAICVSEDSQIILVATYNSQQIHLLSCNGKRLSTLYVPQCAGSITDITIYENQLAVADGSSKVKICELKREN